DAQLAGGGDTCAHDFGEVAAMAEVERHAHAGAVRQIAAQPAGSLGDQLEDAAHPACVPALRIVYLRQQVEPELQGIAPGSMRELIDEALHHEAESVAAGGAKRTGRHAR